MYWRINRRIKKKKEEAEAKRKAAAKKGKKGKKLFKAAVTATGVAVGARRESVKAATMTPTLNKGLSSTSKSSGLKTMTDAASPTKEKTSAAKINTAAKASEESSPARQEQKADLPTNMDGEKKPDFEIKMASIAENDEEGLTRNIERGSVLEIGERAEEANKSPAAGEDDPTKQSNTMLVVAPEISS